MEGIPFKGLNKTMYIYIRHFHKEYKNGRSETFPYDPRIVADENGHIATLRRQLISAYGLPMAVITSPYERTRSTAFLLAGDDIPVIVDPDLSEYLSEHHKDNVKGDSRRPDTMKHEPPGVEDKRTFTARVKRHLRNRRELSQGTYWFVTHGTVIRKVLQYQSENYYPKPLEAVILDPEGYGSSFILTPK